MRLFFEMRIWRATIASLTVAGSFTCSVIVFYHVLFGLCRHLVTSCDNLRISDLDTENQRQSDEDRQRDAAVYLHLLNNLTDLDISEDNPKPNEYKIAKQWGQNRIFVRRVLRSVMGERYQG